MKKILALGVLLIMAIGMLAGCGNTAASDSNTVTDGISIGVIQYVGHPALDRAYEGFVAGLADAGYVEGDNLTLNMQNAQGEQANCPTIANSLINSNYDLYLAIATPAAQAMATATKEKQDVPVLITAVTDAVDVGLVKSNEEPGGNITGTSDLTPVKQQMELLQKLVPDAKKVGFLYTSSEANSEFQINMARKAAEEMGLETMDFTVSNTNEIAQVTQSMVGKVDAVYTPTDNTTANTMATIAKICNEGNLPVIVGEKGMVEQGGLASYSVDYYELGKITAKMAVEILEQDAKPANMPIRYQEEYELIINEDTVQALGITVPEDLLK